MQCLHPRSLCVPDPDDASGYKYMAIEVGCGHCLACGMKYTNEWSTRIILEASAHEHSYFVTLTYDDDHLPDDRKLRKRDVQLFIKRLRKMYPEQVRYYVCGEYGGQTFRPHYHCALFGLNLDNDLDPFYRDNNGVQMYKCPLLSDIWRNGYITVAPFSEHCAPYICKYMNKIDYDMKRLDTFTLMSLKPPIGFLGLTPEISRTGVFYYRGGTYHIPRALIRSLERKNVPVDEIKRKRRVYAELFPRTNKRFDADWRKANDIIENLAVNRFLKK